jgi:hypothetical protein
MVHRFQNIYGISYVVTGTSKDIKSEMQELVLSVMEDKKFPFTTVYVKIPAFLFQKFMEEARSAELKYDEMETKKDMFLIKF